MRSLKYNKILGKHANVISIDITYFPRELLSKIKKEIVKFTSMRHDFSLNKKRYARINNAMSTIKFIPYLKVITKPAHILENIDLSILKYKL